VPPFAVRRAPRRGWPSHFTNPPPAPVSSSRRHGPRARAAAPPRRRGRPRTTARLDPATEPAEHPDDPHQPPCAVSVRRSAVRRDRHLPCPHDPALQARLVVAAPRPPGPSGRSPRRRRRSRTPARLPARPGNSPNPDEPQGPPCAVAVPAVRRAPRRGRPSPSTIPPPTPVSSSRRHGPRARAADASPRRRSRASIPNMARPGNLDARHPHEPPGATLMPFAVPAVRRAPLRSRPSPSRNPHPRPSRRSGATAPGPERPMPAAVAVPERLSRPPLDQGPRRAPHEPHGPPCAVRRSRRAPCAAAMPAAPLQDSATQASLVIAAPRPPGPSGPCQPPSQLPSADPDTRSTTNPEEHPTSPMGRPGAVAVEASRSREARSPHPGSRPRFPLGGAAKLPRYRATGRPRPALRAVRGWSLNTIAATPLPPAGLVSEIRRPRGRPRQRRAAKRLRGGFAKRVVRSGGPRSAPSGLTLGTAPGRLREARGPLGALRGRRRPG
jgi:hypothetical protein